MGKKRKQEPAEAQQEEAQAEPQESGNDAQTSMEGLTEFELKRMELIARNRARMMALGVQVAGQELSKLMTASRQAGTSGPRQPRKSNREPTEPTRKSARHLPQDTDLPQGDEPSVEDQELAAFIIDGECPKCGRIISRGHRAHLDKCQGRPAVQPVVLTDEELMAQAELMKAEEHARLAALELEGLIDVTPEHAIFLVLGSKGNHYQVTISDKSRKCQCPDHKIRKRDCKHIRLTLVNLGCLDDPWNWRQAVDGKFQDAASPADASHQDDKQQARVHQHVKAEHVKAEQIKAEHVKAEQIKAEHVKAEQIKAEPKVEADAQAVVSSPKPSKVKPAKADGGRTRRSARVRS